jgi:hypothetical protein
MPVPPPGSPADEREFKASEIHLRLLAGRRLEPDFERLGRFGPDLAHDALYRHVASKPFACASGRHRSEL